jgi:hypothetical protein
MLHSIRLHSIRLGSKCLTGKIALAYCEKSIKYDLKGFITLVLCHNLGIFLISLIVGLWEAFKAKILCLRVSPEPNKVKQLLGAPLWVHPLPYQQRFE